MPKAKTSEELDAQVAELKKKLAETKKAAQKVKKQEQAEAERVRKQKEIEFNSEFVALSKTIGFREYAYEDRTVYEVIKALMDQPRRQEPDSETVLGDDVQDNGSLLGGIAEIMRQTDGT